MPELRRLVGLRRAAGSPALRAGLGEGPGGHQGAAAPGPPTPPVRGPHEQLAAVLADGVYISGGAILLIFVVVIIVVLARR